LQGANDRLTAATVLSHRLYITYLQPRATASLPPRLGGRQTARAGQPELQHSGQEGNQVAPGTQGTRTSSPLGRAPWKGIIPASSLCLPAPAPSDVSCALTTRLSYMTSQAGKEGS